MGAPVVSPLDIVVDTSTIVAEKMCRDDEPLQCKKREVGRMFEKGGVPYAGVLVRSLRCCVER